MCAELQSGMKIGDKGNVLLKFNAATTRDAHHIVDISLVKVRYCTSVLLTDLFFYKCDLDSQSQSSLSSSQDSVSVPGQSHRGLSDLWKNPLYHPVPLPAFKFSPVAPSFDVDIHAENDKTFANSPKKSWVCCVIKGITDTTRFFFLISFHNKQ